MYLSKHLFQDHKYRIKKYITEGAFMIENGDVTDVSTR